MKNSINSMSPEPAVMHIADGAKYTIPVYILGRIIEVPIYEITYLEGEGNYTFLYTTTGKRYLISKSLKVVRQMLGAQFLRTHKSYMVNTHHVVSRLTDSIQLSCGRSIPIARRRSVETHNMLSGI